MQPLHVGVRYAEVDLRALELLHLLVCSMRMQGQSTACCCWARCLRDQLEGLCTSVLGKGADMSSPRSSS